MHINPEHKGKYTARAGGHEELENKSVKTWLPVVMQAVRLKKRPTLLAWPVGILNR